LSETGIRHRLAAILAADAAGYSRLMAIDEKATVATLDAARAIFKSGIESHQGRVIDMAGDSVLAAFETAAGAVTAALVIQRDIALSLQAAPEDRRMRFRVGVHLGDVIEKADGTIYGDGVNIAARLQALAEPGGVMVSGIVQEAVRDHLSVVFEDRGAQEVKNIARPVRVYRIDSGAQGVARAARRQMPAALRSRWGVACAAVLLVALAIGAWLATADSAKDRRASLASLFGVAPAQFTRTSIAVMPFANQSGDPKRDYFSDGVTDDIIHALGQFSGVLVMSRNAVQAYKGRTATSQEIGHELGVRYIVRGSVRETAEKFRVTVELSDAKKGEQLWSERYDAAGTEVFEIQDRIVKNVVSALAVKLTRIEQQRVFSKPTDNLEAYDLVLRARWLLERLDRGANREARALLARARDLAPDSSEILTALGEAMLQRALYGWIEDPAEETKRAEELGKLALASADSRGHARAHALLATIHSNLGEYAEALSHAENAIALNPSDAKALGVRGAALLYIGRIDEGISALESVRRLDPELGTGVGYNLAVGYYVAGRYRDSLAMADILAARFPRDVATRAVRAASLGQLDQLNEARQAADQLRRINPAYEVENFGSRFANPEHTAKLQQGLRKAGL
jgi:TolB-like protein/class 3 adenylate cyclase/Flp pilus assembly protein TadD